MTYGMKGPFSHLCQLSWLHSLLAAWAPLVFSLAGQHEKLKSPWLSVGAAQQALKHQYVSNIIVIPNPKHSAVQTTKKKINSISAQNQDKDE